MPKKTIPDSSTPAKKARLTLNDVAQALGISRTTVSNAFNRPEQLSKALREDVLGKCRELGYFGPDPAARALRRREVRELAVVYHHNLQFALNDPVGMEFLRGVAIELDKRHMSLQLIPKMGRTLELAAAFHTTADALIVHAEVDAELAPQIRANTKPLALVDTYVPGVPSVRIDDRHGAALAMGHALAAKPQRVLVLGFPLEEKQRTQARKPKVPRSPSVAVERTAGYAEALRAHGREPDDADWIEVDDGDPDSAAGHVRRYLEALPTRTRLAVVAATDRMALAALPVLKASRRVQLAALTGFDDIPEAATAGLTTIRQNARLKGELAVQVALDGLKPVLMPLELVVRAT